MLEILPQYSTDDRYHAVFSCHQEHCTVTSGAKVHVVRFASFSLSPLVVAQLMSCLVCDSDLFIS